MHAELHVKIHKTKEKSFVIPQTPSDATWQIRRQLHNDYSVCSHLGTVGNKGLQGTNNSLVKDGQNTTSLRFQYCTTMQHL